MSAVEVDLPVLGQVARRLRAVSGELPRGGQVPHFGSGSVSTASAEAIVLLQSAGQGLCEAVDALAAAVDATAARLADVDEDLAQAAAS